MGYKRAVGDRSPEMGVKEGAKTTLGVAASAAKG